MIRSFVHRSFLFLVIFLCLGVGQVWAASLVITANDISLSKDAPLAGEDIRIYGKIANRGNDDARGIVKFFDGKKQIGSDQPISVLKGKTADVFVDYKHLAYGDHSLVVKVIPWEQADGTVSATLPLFVDRDSDGDGTPDRQDTDDDNDGVEDTKDAFPLDPKESLDTDRDGIGNNADFDDDNDGLTDMEEVTLGTDPKKFDTDDDKVGDKEDAFPLDPNETLDSDQDGAGDNADPDDDNDGVLDTQDALPKDKTETVDSDHDGIGDNRDTDDDSDGLSDGREKDLGTDAKNPDTDGDGVKDGQDAFPLDATESKDTDHDGIGDTKDPNNHNKAPKLSFEVPTQITPLLPYFFDASQSSDPDGKINRVSWFLNGYRIDQEWFWYLFFIPGRYSLVLMAVDNAGEAAMHSFDVDVSYLPYVVVGVLVLILGAGRKLVIGFRKKRKTKTRR